MFEKEAKDNKPPYAFCSLVTDCKLWEDGFQKGAEFGYNKAMEEIEAQGRILSYEGGIYKCKCQTGKEFESLDGKTWKEITPPKEIKEND